MRRGELGGAVSRRKFIGLTGGSVAGASLLAACGSSSSGSSGDSTSTETAQFGEGDIGIINYALLLEHLEADFYAKLAGSNLLTAAARKAIGQKFGEEEAEHIDALTKAVEKLDGEPMPKPKTDFKLTSDAEALAVAGQLENIGAAAYLRQLPNIQSDSLLSTVLSIHSVEGRHAASINGLSEEPITPDGAFAKPATVKVVLAIVNPFLAQPVTAADSST